jgi:hypothetical protein
MEASPIGDEEASGNEYEEDEDDDDDEWSPFIELLLFPFLCLDAKGGEEYLLIMLSCRGLKILKLVCVGRVDMDS